MEGQQFPDSKYPEFAKLPTESLIGILEALFFSSPELLKDLKACKEDFLREKRNGFQDVSESYYRDLFRLNAFAPLLLRDGKINTSGANFFGCVPDYEEKEMEDDYEENEMEDDYEENEMEDDYEEKEMEEDDEDYDDKEEKDWIMILMGKQFVLKFMELENIKADRSKESVQRADWALSCQNGEMTNSVLFLNERINKEANKYKAGYGFFFQTKEQWEKEEL